MKAKQDTDAAEIKKLKNDLKKMTIKKDKYKKKYGAVITCNICLTRQKETMLVMIGRNNECGHKLCSECWSKWFERELENESPGSCPFCRVEVNGTIPFRFE